jgi:hypothetical protein
MPPERNTSQQDDERANEIAEELRTAVGGDAAREVRFWRGRADELAAQIERLQARLLALADLLPARHARLLACDLEDLRREPDWPDPLAGWKETTSLEPASVATELPRLWTRLGRPAPR